jgi:hypothetical protein
MLSAALLEVEGTNDLPDWSTGLAPTEIPKQGNSWHLRLHECIALARAECLEKRLI